MPKEFSRARRVAEQIQRELADLVRTGVKDPRLGMVSISGVKVSRDLGYATVYISSLDDKEKSKISVEILNHAAGFLRHELGHRMVIRSVPQLRFVLDESVERGMRLSSLIDAAIASDQDKAKDRKP